MAMFLLVCGMAGCWAIRRFGPPASGRMSIQDRRAVVFLSSAAQDRKGGLHAGGPRACDALLEAQR